MRPSETSQCPPCHQLWWFQSSLGMRLASSSCLMQKTLKMPLQRSSPSTLLQTGSGSNSSAWTREKPLDFRSDEQNYKKKKKNPNCSCFFVVFFLPPPPQLKTSCVGGEKELREREEDAKCPSHDLHFRKTSNKAETRQQQKPGILLLPFSLHSP